MKTGSKTVSSFAQGMGTTIRVGFLAGILVIFALTSCEMMMDNMGGNDGTDNTPSAAIAAEAMETHTGSATNLFTVRAAEGENEALTVDLSATAPITGSGGSFNDDIFVNIRNLIGGNGVNTFTGNAEANSFTGGTAPDVFNGGGGNDILNGGAGDDMLTGAAGNDTLDGGAGNDTIIYTSPADFLIQQNTGGSGYSLTGGANGVDIATNIETINLSNGNDSLISVSTAISAINIDAGEADDDTDNDTIALANSAVSFDLSTTNYTNFETILGGTGNDTITGSTGVETINGGVGDDTINGTGGADTLNGGPGNDVFTGLGNGTTIDGGPDIDTLDLTNATLRGDTVDVNISDATVTIGGATLASGMARTTMVGSVRDTFTVTNVENFYGPTDTIFHLYGDDGANIFEAIGILATNSFWGNGGDDIMVAAEAGVHYFEGFSNEVGNNDRIDLRKYFSQIKNVDGITITQMDNHLQFRIRDLDDSSTYVHLRDVFGSGKLLDGYADAAEVTAAFADGGTLDADDFFIFAPASE